MLARTRSSDPSIFSDVCAGALKLLIAVLHRGRGPLQRHPALGSGDVVRPDVHTRLPILQPRGLALVTVLQGVPVLLLQARSGNPLPAPRSRPKEVSQ